MRENISKLTREVLNEAAGACKYNEREEQEFFIDEILSKYDYSLLGQRTEDEVKRGIKEEFFKMVDKNRI